MKKLVLIFESQVHNRKVDSSTQPGQRIGCSVSGYGRLVDGVSILSRLLGGSSKFAIT